MQQEQIGKQAADQVGNVIANALRKKEKQDQELKQSAKQVTTNAVANEVGKVARPHVEKLAKKAKQAFDDKVKPIFSGKQAPSGLKGPSLGKDR